MLSQQQLLCMHAPTLPAAPAPLPPGVICALPKIITTGFKAIQLIYFFTAGEDEVKCWQIRKGSKAPQAAGACRHYSEREAAIALSLLRERGVNMQCAERPSCTSSWCACCCLPGDASCLPGTTADMRAAGAAVLLQQTADSAPGMSLVWTCTQHVHNEARHATPLQEPSTRTLSVASSAPR
jgi:hypothetical protein